jgi:PAS domain S-box-containing protein
MIQQSIMRQFLLILFILLFILPVLAVVQPAAAQQTGVALTPGAHLRFEHITIDDGLSQNAGLTLLQDHRGYLWIGTQDGLNRYDGYHITQFKHNPADPASISYNGILALFEDADGFLWIGTWGGGLDRYDPYTGVFDHYQPDPNNPASLSHPVVTDIVDDAQGNLWIGTLGGLERLNPSTGIFTHFRHDPANPASLSSDAISIILPASDGTLWIGTGAFGTPGAGLNHFDPATGQVERISQSGACLASPNISDILLDAQGSLWIAHGGYAVTGGGIDRFDPQTQNCAHFDNTDTFDDQITDNNITDMIFDRDGALWISTWSSGVWYMPPESIGEFTGIHHNPADPESLSNDNTFSLLQDRSGVMWIGTLSAGINLLNPDTLQFHTYKNDATSPHSLPNNHVGAFAQTPDGVMWVGTWEAGLARFDPASGTFTSYRNEPQNAQSISSDLVMSLYADRDNTLWVGTLGGGVNHFDPATGLFTRYQNDPADPASLLDDQVTYITRDNAGRLWLSNMSGLSRFDAETNGFVNYPMETPAVTMKAAGDDLWIGTWGGGVSRLNLAIPANLEPATASFTTLTHDTANPNSLGENSVWSIHVTPDGMMWFGTQGGLTRYDAASGQFKTYLEKDGLRNSTILGIVESADGLLWVTTNNGLAKFDPQAETFQIYDKKDGLQGNEFNSNAYFLAANGEIYIGGVGGFSVFDPLNLRSKTTPPGVVITQFSIFNTPQPFDSSGETPIRLNYEQNFISFEFAALDFRAPAKNKYAYKLEGFDKDWISAGTRNYASYTNLPGGQYTFRVKAANSDGVWNEIGVSLPLIVTPPFWRTWPFLVGLLVGAFFLGVALFQWRVRVVREQNTRLQAMVYEQKRVESELRESEARFRTLYDSSEMGIVLVDLGDQGGLPLDEERFKYLVANQRLNPAMLSMFGYTAEEMKTTSIANLIYPDDQGVDANQFRQLLTGEIDCFRIEKRFVRKDGSVFWGRLTDSLARAANGVPRMVIGIIEDINEERHAKEQLAAQEAEHRRLLEERLLERTNELNQANALLQLKAAQDAVTAERTRLARDLHDAVTQTLFSTTIIADVLPEIWDMNPQEGRRRLEEVRQLTRGALAEMRTLLVELRPNALIEVPLPTLLRQLTDAMIGRSRINIQLSTDGECKLPADVQVGLYRIAQEALNNIVKHAKASQAIVTLRMCENVSGGSGQVMRGNNLRLTVADNGHGFDPSMITADHLGLKIMRERAEAIGAKFTLYSESGEGTQVTVIWQA